MEKGPKIRPFLHRRLVPHFSDPEPTYYKSSNYLDNKEFLSLEVTAQQQGYAVGTATVPKGFS